MRRPAAPEARQNPRRQASAVATTHTSPDANAGPVGPLRKQPEFRDEQVSLRLPCRRSARAAAYGAREPFCGNAFANASGAEVADGRLCDRAESCELVIPFAKSTCPVAAFVTAAARRSRPVPPVSGMLIPSKHDHGLLGTDGTDGRPRPRSPGCRLPRGSGHLIAAGTRAAPTRPQRVSRSARRRRPLCRGQAVASPTPTQASGLLEPRELSSTPSRLLTVARRTAAAGLPGRGR